MKKILTASFISLITTCAAMAAIPWWQQPTICRLNPSNCYVSMGTGFDSEMWDADANCWGLKLICPQALLGQSANRGEPVAMGRAEIARGDRISQDFDTDILNNGCFGVRKTMANGSMASVNGNYVNVWCSGLLDNPDEILANGEIMYNGQPTCTQLANNGYVGVINGRCYGKYYNPNEYFIDCGTSSNLLPQRLIILNGADINTASSNTPASQAAADEIFEKMQQTSAVQRDKYYEK